MHAFFIILQDWPWSSTAIFHQRINYKFFKPYSDNLAQKSKCPIPNPFFCRSLNSSLQSQLQAFSAKHHKMKEPTFSKSGEQHEVRYSEKQKAVMLTKEVWNNFVLNVQNHQFFVLVSPENSLIRNQTKTGQGSAQKKLWERV